MAQNFTKTENLTALEVLNLIAEKFEQLEQRLLTKIVQPKEVLNSKEASKHLGITMSWLDKLCSNNKIPYHKTGKLRYFKVKELDKYKLKYIVKSVDDLEEEEHDLSFGKKINLSTSKRKY